MTVPRSLKFRLIVGEICPSQSVTKCPRSHSSTKKKSMSTVLKDIDCKIICCFSFLFLFFFFILQKLVYLNYLQKHPHCLKKVERSMSLKSAWRSSAAVVLHLSSSPWEGFSSVMKETYIHLDVLCCYSAVKRLMKEAAELREPTEHYHAQPLEVGPLLQHLTAPFTVIYTHTRTHRLLMCEVIYTHLDRLRFL